MRLTIVRHGCQVGWFGTQDEAKDFARDTGGSWSKVEVPTDKPGLLAWLNEVAAPATAAMRVDLQNARAVEVIEEFQAGDYSGPAGRKPAARADAEPADDTYQHMSASNVLRRMDAQLAANRGAEAIADYVATAVPEEVALVAAAVAMRLTGAIAERLPAGKTLTLEAAEAL